MSNQNTKNLKKVLFQNLDDLYRDSPEDIRPTVETITAAKAWITKLFANVEIGFSYMVTAKKDVLTLSFATSSSITLELHLSNDKSAALWIDSGYDSLCLPVQYNPTIYIPL